MKKIPSVLVFISIALSSFSQTPVRQPVTTVKATTDSSAIQKATISTNTAKSKNSLKLPELKITGLEVSFYNSTSTDSTKRFLEISFTVMNDGVVEVPYHQIGLQGRILEYADRPNGLPGGGTAMSFLGGALQPRASASGSFRCYTMAPINLINMYQLQVDNSNRIREIDETNNTKVTWISRQ